MVKHPFIPTFVMEKQQSASPAHQMLRSSHNNRLLFHEFWSLCSSKSDLEHHPILSMEEQHPVTQKLKKPLLIYSYERTHLLRCIIDVRPGICKTVLHMEGVLLALQNKPSAAPSSLSLPSIKYVNSQTGSVTAAKKEIFLHVFCNSLIKMWSLKGTHAGISHLPFPKLNKINIFFLCFSMNGAKFSSLLW